MFSVIKKPLVTEKNSIHNARNVYVFEVDKKADKTQITNAVEKLFDVKVESVRTMQCRKRAKRHRTGYTKVRYWKKALVQVKADQKISIFEGV